MRTDSVGSRTSPISSRGHIWRNVCPAAVFSRYNATAAQVSARLDAAAACAVAASLPRRAAAASSAAAPLSLRAAVAAPTAASLFSTGGGCIRGCRGNLEDGMCAGGCRGGCRASPCTGGGCRLDCGVRVRLLTGGGDVDVGCAPVGSVGPDQLAGCPARAWGRFSLASEWGTPRRQRRGESSHANVKSVFLREISVARTRHNVVSLQVPG